jgi:hypothetical protein
MRFRATNELAGKTATGIHVPPAADRQGAQDAAGGPQA